MPEYDAYLVDGSSYHCSEDAFVAIKADDIKFVKICNTGEKCPLDAKAAPKKAVKKAVKEPKVDLDADAEVKAKVKVKKSLKKE